MSQQQFKTINQTYLFNIYKKEYEESIVNFAKATTIIDTKSKEFEDIAYDVKKRQIGSFLVDMMHHQSIKLCITESKGATLNRSMRVLTAKDIKGGSGKYVIYVDCTGIISKENNRFECKEVDKLIALLLDASVNLIYFSSYGARLTGKADIIRSGAYSFASLFNNIINYLFKTNTIQNIHNRCMFLAAQYFIRNILAAGQDGPIASSAVSVAKNIAKMSDREVELMDMYITKDSFKDIDAFINTIREALKLSKLTTEGFVTTWVKMYTPSTLFALEYFPAFSAMLTNTYIGCYLNNQSTIEKVTNRGLPEYVKSVLAVGGDFRESSNWK